MWIEVSHRHHSADNKLSLMKKPKFRKVYCEISNSCNLKCDFCPSSTDSGIEKQFMDEKLFAQLVPQLKPLAYLLCLHVMGEPMYHPDLGRFLDICSEHKMNVSIVTNGTLLSAHHQQLLMHPAVTQVNFSLQSFEGNFPEVDNKEYLNSIFEFIERTFNERQDLRINLRLWNSENFEISMIRNKTIIEHIQDYFKIPSEVIDNLSHLGNRLKGYLYLNFADRFEWPRMDMPIQSEHGTCPALKNQFGILADGTLIPCCLDKDGVISLGNCRTNTVQEILDSDRAMTMLNGFKKCDLVEPICKRCTYIKRFR